MAGDDSKKVLESMPDHLKKTLKDQNVKLDDIVSFTSRGQIMSYPLKERYLITMKDGKEINVTSEIPDAKFDDGGAHPITQVPSDLLE